MIINLMHESREDELREAMASEPPSIIKPKRKRITRTDRILAGLSYETPKTARQIAEEIGDTANAVVGHLSSIRKSGRAKRIIVQDGPNLWVRI